jgi:two-component system LytT family sensor kinase
MIKVLTNHKVLIRHILVWSIFISYELTFTHFTVGVLGKVTYYAIFYILNIGLFYFNAHVVLDYAFFKSTKPYLISIISIFLELPAYIIGKVLIDSILSSPNHPIDQHVKLSDLYMVTNIWRGIYFIGLSIAYWAMLSFVRFKERNHLMETEQLKSEAHTLELENKYISVENAYLQNQISPHLLFNSLNFIHNKVYKESAEAGNSVSRLADLMRYSLVSADDKRMVNLSEEVTQTENLIELCRMRFPDQFYLRFKKQGKIAGIQVLPLILITLVENVMKHGDMGDKKHPARISLNLRDDLLNFETSNKKRNTNLYPKTGLGLKNIEKRLSNYYHDRYKLLIHDDEETFTVNLTILL